MATDFDARDRWLAYTKDFSNQLSIVGRDGARLALDHPHHADGARINLAFGLEGGIFRSFGYGGAHGHIALWSAVSGQLIAQARPYDPSSWIAELTGALSTSQDRGLFLFGHPDRKRMSVDALTSDGTYERLGEIPLDVFRQGLFFLDMARGSGTWVGAVEGDGVHVVEVGEHALSPPRLLGRMSGPAAEVAADPLGRFFATADRRGEIRIWDVTGGSIPRVFQGPERAWRLWISDDGSFLLAANDGSVWIWDLGPDQPRLLRRVELADPAGRFVFDPVRGGLAMKDPGADTPPLVAGGAGRRRAPHPEAWCISLPVDAGLLLRWKVAGHLRHRRSSPVADDRPPLRRDSRPSRLGRGPRLRSRGEVARLLVAQRRAQALAAGRRSTGVGQGSLRAAPGSARATSGRWLARRTAAGSSPAPRARPGCSPPTARRPGPCPDSSAPARPEPRSVPTVAW